MQTLIKAVEAYRQRLPFALATVTWVRGPSSGQQTGRAIIHPDGRMEGWVGGACAAPTLVEAGLAALKEGKARLLVLGEKDSRPEVESVSMACASEGAMEVLVEPVVPAPDLRVMGSSPMARTLVDLAKRLGWEARLVEEAVLSETYPSTMVVVASQGHFDEPALLAALAGPASYIGLVASPARAETVKEWLSHSGVSEADLARVSSPAGIDLGRISHQEIAVSILAELVQFRSAVGATGDVADVATPETATDPVCGMTVGVEDAVWVSVRGEEKVYFCAAGCQQTWEAQQD